MNRAFVTQLGYDLTDLPDMASWFATVYRDEESRAGQQWQARWLQVGAPFGDPVRYRPLKQINDRYGHPPPGMLALWRVWRASCAAVASRVEHLIRWGGEEFC